jgi:hypothetical protein
MRLVYLRLTSVRCFQVHCSAVLLFLGDASGQGAVGYSDCSCCAELCGVPFTKQLLEAGCNRSVLAQRCVLLW